MNFKIHKTDKNSSARTSQMIVVYTTWKLERNFSHRGDQNQYLIYPKPKHLPLNHIVY